MSNGNTYTFLLAGFGGQGILFLGKVISYAGMISGKEVSWLPSYGPAMRGGTANCSVTISDKPIGSPLVLNPAILVALNLPSYDSFEAFVEKGGKVFIDSSLVQRAPGRDDIDTFAVEATNIASENGVKTLANMIVLGKLLKETQFVTKDSLIAALKKAIPAKKQDMLEINIKALELGYNM